MMIQCVSYCFATNKVLVLFLFRRLFLAVKQKILIYLLRIVALFSPDLDAGSCSTHVGCATTKPRPYDSNDDLRL